MAKFKPGDRARIVEAHPNHNLVGHECIVEAYTTPEEPRLNEQWYVISVPGKPSLSKTGQWRTPESTLAPISPARTWFEQNIQIKAPETKAPAKPKPVDISH